DSDAPAGELPGDADRDLRRARTGDLPERARRGGARAALRERSGARGRQARRDPARHRSRRDAALLLGPADALRDRAPTTHAPEVPDLARGRRRTLRRGHRVPAGEPGRRPRGHRLDLLGNRRVRIKLWGTRGSLATPGPDTMRYGGNTSCVEVRSRSGTVL